MIDFYKFNPLSIWGKDAGSQTMTEYLKTIENYDKYLAKIKKLKNSNEKKGGK